MTMVAANTLGEYNITLPFSMMVPEDRKLQPKHWGVGEMLTAKSAKLVRSSSS